MEEVGDKNKDDPEIQVGYFTYGYSLLSWPSKYRPNVNLLSSDMRQYNACFVFVLRTREGSAHLAQTSDQFSPNYLIKAIFMLQIWSLICIILVLELS